MNKRTTITVTAGAVVVSALLMTTDRRRAIEPPSTPPRLMQLRVYAPGEAYAIAETCGQTYTVPIGADGTGVLDVFLAGPCGLKYTFYPSKRVDVLAWGVWEGR